MHSLFNDSNEDFICRNKDGMRVLKDESQEKPYRVEPEVKREGQVTSVSLPRYETLADALKGKRDE